MVLKWPDLCVVDNCHRSGYARHERHRNSVFWGWISEIKLQKGGDSGDGIAGTAVHHDSITLQENASILTESCRSCICYERKIVHPHAWSGDVVVDTNHDN